MCNAGYVRETARPWRTFREEVAKVPAVNAQRSRDMTAFVLPEPSHLLEVYLPPLILSIFHVKTHKGFIVFGGGGEIQVLYITAERRAGRTRGRRGGGETYRARLIEQHLVRVNEKLALHLYLATA